MMKAFRNVARVVAVTAVGVLCAGTATSALAAWPDKPIKLVVPFPPAGNADVMGRMVADHLTQALGQPVIVDNKPGAGSMIGSQAVARSAPDGYTFLLGSIANAMNHFFYKKPMVDITKELVPVAQLVAVPNYLAINNNFPARTMPEIVAYAKANPGKVSCATSGVGTSPYMSCVLLQKLAGVNIVSVPYKGGAPALQHSSSSQMKHFRLFRTNA
jgi:tripartite-type tricarboxylate transporter receptor subunit TctC